MGRQRTLGRRARAGGWHSPVQACICKTHQKEQGTTGTSSTGFFLLRLRDRAPAKLNVSVGSILQHLLLHPKVQREQPAQGKGAPARALLPSRFLSLQALCNPRPSPWPSPHRGAADQWKKSFPTCPPFHAQHYHVMSKQLVINPPTCLQRLGLVLPRWKESGPTQKLLRSQVRSPVGCPQLLLLLWIGVWVEKPIGPMPGCAWRGGGSAKRDAV